MSKEYRVMLSITLTETHFVEADTKDAALEIAKNASNAIADGGDYEVFEIVRVK